MKTARTDRVQEGLAGLVAAIRDWLDDARRHATLADLDLELTIELVEAVLLAAEAPSSTATHDVRCAACRFRSLLDQLRAATSTARFGLVAAIDRQHDDGAVVCAGDGDCRRDS
ncbi:MAG TPA: hypothetical protein VH084_15130 [Mycobacterium sp.]|jgi:hypothetical protein|nr:hypothetical protein [Mycobacterium sp.]